MDSSRVSGNGGQGNSQKRRERGASLRSRFRSRFVEKAGDGDKLSSAFTANPQIGDP
nr:MAG TPA: kinase [Caudoviricetes sp.]